MRFIDILKSYINKVANQLPACRLTLKRPLIFLYSICALWKLRLALVISILAMIYIVPPVIGSTVDFLFQKHKSKKLFGLIKKKSDSHDMAYLFGIYSCYLLVITANVSLIILYSPKGIKSAADFSSRCENKADILGAKSRIRAKLLYTIANQLLVDPECWQRIKDKSAECNNKNISQTLHDNNDNIASSVTKGQDKNNEYADDNQRYKLINNIGHGAMGVVNLATDLVLERKVAIKELPPYLLAEELTIQRFKQEATALARLSHPNIVQVYDLVVNKDKIFMVLEYIKGQDLSEFLAENGPLKQDEGIKLISKIAQALSVAHENGIIHRDIKPANILLTDWMEPKITDFGIARLSTDSSLTQEGLTLGSPPYMSPEQCSGKEIDHRSDIYSLGITFYELLTGAVPFEGDIVSILSQHLTQQPVQPSKKTNLISPEIDTIILKMLEKEVEQRIQSSSELSQKLNNISQPVVSR